MADSSVQSASPSNSTNSVDRVASIDNVKETDNNQTRQNMKELDDKIADLEAQLKATMERSERQNAIATETIKKKNEMVDVMRIKLNRYEFAIKEAILFLGKPMLNYEEWVAHGSGENQEARSGLPSTTSKGSNSTESKALTPAQLAEKQQAQHAADFNSVTINTRLGQGTKTFEVLCMECMRLALNYLKNAQASVHAMSQTKGTSEPDPLPKLNIEDTTQEPATRAQSSTADGQPLRGASPSGQSGSDKDESPRRRTLSADWTTGTKTPPPAGSLSSIRSGRSYSATPAHDRHTSAQKAAAALFHAATSLPEDDESDLATNPQRITAPNTPTASRCHQCRDAMLQLHQYQEAIDGLKQDITDLADQLEEEREMRDRIQQSKDLLEQELEELTAQLFDQANHMVIEEAKMRDELEQSNRQLRGELNEVVANFQRRDEEFRHLRASLRALETAKLRSSSLTNLHSTAGSSSPHGSQGNLAGAGSSLRRASVMRRGSILASPYGSNTSLAGNPGANPTLSVDGIIYSEFQDYVKETMSTTAPAIAVATAFFKRCIMEDIEPCLFYTYHPETGGLFKQAPGLSASSKKRLLENVSRGWCEVVPTWASRSNPSVANKSASQPSSPSLLSSNAQLSQQQQQITQRAPPRAKCLMCTLVRDCEYKVRFVPPSNKPQSPTSPSSSSSAISSTTTAPNVPWYPVCRFCRDRVLAVVEFFAFLSHIRDGVKQGATILGMFRQALWLRRRMAACRIGSNALFEGDVAGSAYSGGGIGRFEGGGEWEKWVQILP